MLDKKAYIACLKDTQDNPTRTDVDAYLAGFFDGEGHISIRKDPRREWSCYVEIGASQVVREPLDLLTKIYGGYVTSKTPPTKSTVRQCYAWKCSVSKDVMWALWRMLPWLIVKRAKARSAIIVLQNRPHKLNGGQISHYQKIAITKALRNVHVVRIRGPLAV